MSKRWWGKKTVIYEADSGNEPLNSTALGAGQSFVDGLSPVPPVELPEPETPAISGDQIWHYEALQTFHSPEFQCAYRQGKEYSFRTKDADHPDCDNRRLLAMLPSWVDQGKVKRL